MWVINKLSTNLKVKLLKNFYLKIHLQRKSRYENAIKISEIMLISCTSFATYWKIQNVLFGPKQFLSKPFLHGCIQIFYRYDVHVYVMCMLQHSLIYWASGLTEYISVLCCYRYIPYVLPQGVGYHIIHTTIHIYFCIIM